MIAVKPEIKGEDEKQSNSSVTPIVQPVKIRQKMMYSQPPANTSKQLVKSGSKTMTALGRPMRKSASQFSARRLLDSGEFRNDEDSSEDADWKPKPIGAGSERASSSTSTLSVDEPYPKPISLNHLMAHNKDYLLKKSSAVCLL